jgi:hypothetical protein
VRRIAMLAKSTGKKKAKEVVGKPARAAVETALVVDFPVEGERILPGHYAIRINAPAEERVEVSIDGGDWQECRSAVGFHWYDWQPTKSGRHTVCARSMRPGTRSAKRSEVRSCFVQADSTN